MAVCSKCKKTGDLRPYGKGGALVCFPCGMDDLPTTKKEFGALLGAAEDEGTGSVVLTPDGPKPLAPRKGKKTR